jgi:hypothetical protein
MGMNYYDAFLEGNGCSTGERHLSGSVFFRFYKHPFNERLTDELHKDGEIWTCGVRGAPILLRHGIVDWNVPEIQLQRARDLGISNSI